MNPPCHHRDRSLAETVANWLTVLSIVMLLSGCASRTPVTVESQPPLVPGMPVASKATAPITPAPTAVIIPPAPYAMVMDYVEPFPLRTQAILYSTNLLQWSPVWTRTNDFTVASGNTHWPRTILVTVSNLNFNNGNFKVEHSDFAGKFYR